MIPYASWKKAQKVKKLLFTWLAVVYLLSTITSITLAQSPFTSSKQSLLLSNAQSGASERWASLMFPSSATANYRLILPSIAPTTGQFLSVVSISGNDATLQWSNIAASSWLLTGNATTNSWDGTTGSFLGTTSAQPLTIATTNTTAQDIRFYTGVNGANERMRITGSGNIGIGITAPDAPLQIATVRNTGDALFHVGNAQQFNQFVVKDRAATSAIFGIQPGGLNVGIPGYEQSIWSSQQVLNRIDIWDASYHLTLRTGSTTGISGDIQLAPSNAVSLINTDNSAREFRFNEPSNSGTNYTAFKAGAQTANISYTLPSALPTNNGVMQTTSTGTLSWTDLGAGQNLVTTAGGTATRVAFWNGTTTLSSNADLFWDNTNSRLGIGTATPSASLDVANTARIGLTSATTPQLIIDGGAGGADLVRLRRTSGVTTEFGWSLNAGLMSFTDVTNSQVQIQMGGTTPTLTVGSNNGATSSAGGFASILQGSTSGIAVPNLATGDFTIRGGTSSGNATPSRLVFATTTVGASGTALQSFSNRMVIDGNGNVGIGTMTPNATLQLGNTISNRRIVLWEASNDDHQFYGIGINSGILRFQTAATSNDFTFNAGTSSSTSNELMRVRGNGSVGIGISATTSRLHIDGGTGTDTYLTFTNGSTTGQAITDGFVVGAEASGNALVWTRENVALRFATTDAERMRIAPSGAVGIGTASPSVGLHYSGDNTILTSSAGQTQNISNYLLLGNLNNASYQLRIQEPNGSGSNYNALLSPVQSYDIRYTLPALVPTVNQVLSASTVTGSSGAGYDVSLSWVNPSGGGGASGVTGTGVVGEVAFWTTSTQITSDPRFFWDDGLLRLGIGTNTPDEKLDVEGHLLISNGNSLANELRIAEPFYTTGNLNYTGFTTQSQAGNLIYTLPGVGPANGSFGSNRFVMATNLAGSSATLGWETFWSPQGNAGTNPASAFIGTTDNQPLAFRTNNTEQMRIVNSQLQLRSGNGGGAFTINQLVMGWNGASDYQYMHSIKTRHNSGSASDNAIDFYIWRQGTDAATASPTLHGLTIEGASGATANIGIGGVTSPKANLHLPNVVGNRRAIFFLDGDNDHQFYGFGINSGILRYQLSNTSASHVFYAGASASTSNELMRVQGNGNVGIGTASPSTRLEVAGGGGGNVDFVVNGRIRTGDGVGNGGVWLSNSSDAFVGNNGGNVGFFTSGASWNAFQIVKASGNVGIGTTGPTARLQVNGTSRFVGGSMLIDTVSSGSAGQIQLMNPARTFQTNIQAGAQTANITYTLPTVAPTVGQVLSSDASGNMSWTTTLTGASGWSLSGNTPTASWNGTTGSFLGTTNTQPLSIATTNATAQDIRFFTGANGSLERMRILSSGNIGIKTTNPTQDLEVAGTVFVNAENSAFTVDALTNSRLGLIKKSGLDPVIAAGSGTNLSLGHWSTSNINGNINSGTFNERVRITPTGNVGIGTTTPTSLLHVNGASRFSGGNILIDTSATSTAGQLQLMNPARTFQTNIRAGAQTANITYTLPTASPTANGQVLSATTSGVMSWADPLPSGAIGSITFIRKLTDEIQTNSIALQDDDHLTFSAAANQVYEVEIILALSTNNSSNGGCRFTVVSPSGSTVFLSSTYSVGATSGQTVDNFIRTSGSVNQLQLLDVTTDLNKVRLKGYISTAGTAGAVTLQWAQVTSSSAETRVLANSFMRVVRIQ